MTRLLVLAAATLLVVGCGDEEDPSSGDPLRVEDAVLGETPAGADAALYFEIVGGAGDALVGASSPAAEATSLHTIEAVEGGGVMYPTDRIELGGDVTTFAPIDKHVMLEGLAVDLVAGETVRATLQFEEHGDVDVMVAVVPLADLADLLPES